MLAPPFLHETHFLAALSSIEHKGTLSQSLIAMGFFVASAFDSAELAVELAAASTVSTLFDGESTLFDEELSTLFDDSIGAPFERCAP